MPAIIRSYCAAGNEGHFEIRSFGWPAGSDSLVAELGFTTKVQLTAWRPGDTRLSVVSLGPREAVTAIVTG